MICPFKSYLGGGKSVCKTAYMAIMDIRGHAIEQAQKKVRLERENEQKHYLIKMVE
jgi:hypothetical protein